MKHNLKRLVCTCLAFVTVFSLCACGKKAKDTLEYADLTYSYKSKELAVPDFIQGINTVDYADGKIYFSGYYEEYSQQDYVYEERFGVMNEDGTDAKHIVLPKAYENNEGYLSQVFFDPNGSLWYLETVNVYNQENTEAENGAVMPMPRDVIADNTVMPETYTEPTQKFFIHKVDVQGNELMCKEITSPREQDYFYISSMSFDNDGNIYIPFENFIIIYDSEMNKTGEIENDNYIDIFTISEKSGKGYIRYWGENGVCMREVDIASKTISDTDVETLKGDLRYSSLMQGDTTNDFYINNRFSLYSYNIGQEPVQFVNWIDSDVNPNEVSCICVISPEKLIYTTQLWDSEEQKQVSTINLLTKREGDDLKPKVKLSYGAVYVDYEVQKSIIDFNKKNDKYRIQIVDYSLYNTEEDYEAGVKQLNNDIIAGKMPDILQVSNSSIPFDSYVSKGLFADLYPLIEKDSTINMDDFFTNIIKAFEHDGKLYEIAPTFTVQTVVGKKSIFGNESSISVSQLNKILQSMPEGAKAFSDMTKRGVLQNSLYLIGNNFVDKITGVCHFDEQSFIDLLEFANTFPLEYNNEQYDDPNYWEEYEKQYRNDKVLLMQMGVYSPDTLHYIEKVQFGEEVSFVGYPTQEGESGSSIIPHLELAISSKTKSMDGAWEFVKYFLSKDFYDTQDYGLTLSKEQFERAAKKSMTPVTYKDENGVEVEQPNYYYLDGEEIDIGYPTQEQIDRVRDFIQTVNVIGRFDNNLTQIITEEADYFFNGQKSAQDVAGIIQSKASIYVSESR